VETKLSQEYLKLQKKYKLPDFLILDKEFEFCEDEIKYPLKQVRKRMSEVVEGYGKIVEEVMHPESSIAGLYESKALDEVSKNSLFTCYKELMKLLRFALEVSLLNTEQDDADFINKSFSGWMKIKKDLLPIVRLLKTSWDKSYTEEQQGYMG